MGLGGRGPTPQRPVTPDPVRRVPAGLVASQSLREVVALRLSGEPGGQRRIRVRVMVGHRLQEGRYRRPLAAVESGPLGTHEGSERDRVKFGQERPNRGVNHGFTGISVPQDPGHVGRNEMTEPFRAEEGQGCILGDDNLLGNPLQWPISDRRCRSMSSRQSGCSRAAFDGRRSAAKAR